MFDKQIVMCALLMCMTDNTVNFTELDIPVNAAATALKDYLKQLPPLLPQNQLLELTTIASEYKALLLQTLSSSF